jgi:hypothetical protein
MAAQPRLLPAQQFRLGGPNADSKSCAVRNVTSSAAERRALTAPADGYLTVRTSGSPTSDWDLGIADRTSGHLLNGSASMTSTEVATTIVRKGQKLAVQVCRRAGTSSGVTVSTQFTKATLGGGSGTMKLVRVLLGDAAERERLESLGLDLADHGTARAHFAILHSAADQRKLEASGLSFSTRINDLAARSRANLRREVRITRAARTARRKGRIAQAASALPSGSTQYRTLANIQDELKDLRDANPTLVRLFELPRRTTEGRAIMGIEIARGVGSPTDGRPVMVQVGTHHAREWPANESTLEWGYELIKNFTRDPTYNRPFDPELDRVVNESRSFVIPVMNVDGFDATIESEGRNPDGSYEDPVDSGGEPGRDTSGDQSEGSGAYKRKTCTDPDPALQALPCIARTSYHASPDPTDTASDLPDRGVDPNRNYGVEWGGPGTSSDVEDLTYHGPEAWSEPETQAMREFLRDLQPTVLITNHTFTGLILRPPGTSDFGPVPDEDLLRRLGDVMGRETDYISQYSYQLYDTTGTTDDYIYDGLGGFSYTPEIGKDEFHPAYADYVPEYDGQFAEDANGNPTTQKLGGLREAYTRAALATIGVAPEGDGSSWQIDSIITGTAPAGRTLQIEKTISYDTSSRPDDDGELNGPDTITEPRRTRLQVPDNGQFVWHVNPSSQPRSGEVTPWKLTCRDASDKVLESRDVFVARGQTVNLGLTCGAAAGGGGGSTPTTPAPATTCTDPNGFRSVSVSRRGKGLRISFRRKVSNKVTVDVFQVSKGRRINRQPIRVKRFKNRTKGFTWAGKTSKKRPLVKGTYYVRFRIVDALEKVDTRRVVVERKNSRFTKRGKYIQENRCPAGT